MASMASNIPQQPLNTNDDDQSYHMHLVWLDKNLGNFNNKRRLKLLSEIDPLMKSFTCEREGIDYIRQQNDRNTTSYIIFIISGALSQQIIPEIHDYRCIVAFFIFCNNREDYEHLDFRKLRAICTDTNILMDQIELFIDKTNAKVDFSLPSNQEPTPSDPMPSHSQYQIRNLKEDAARFLWFYVCHNYMIKLENDDNAEAKKVMIDFCRKQYQESSMFQSHIDDFAKESLENNEERAIWWYTANTFIFRCINTVLRKENISHIYSCRYIIKLLCCELKKRHRKYIRQYRKTHSNTKLRLYRGQQLESSQIHLLENNIHNLISFNGFVSTTRSKDVAIEFSKRLREGLKPVLIEIDVDITCEQNVAFADISELSRFREEQEILISIGSIFRIESVKYDHVDQLHRVRLSLGQLEQLSINKYIEQTYPTDVFSTDQSILFGKLLFDMGECDLALKHLDNAYGRLWDTNNRIGAIYLNNIGVCYNATGKKDKALKYYEKALKIYEQTGDGRGLGACYHNIASFYHAQGEHDLALFPVLEALDHRQEYPLEKALTLDLLGRIYLAKQDQEAARFNFQDALDIRLKYLSETNPSHPDIGLSYQNLGKADTKFSHFTDAYSNYLQADRIYRHSYPTSHPLVLEITRCLEQVKRRLR